MIEPALAAARRAPSLAIQPRLQATVSALGDAQARGRIVVLGPREGRRADTAPRGRRARPSVAARRRRAPPRGTRRSRTPWQRRERPGAGRIPPAGAARARARARVRVRVRVRVPRSPTGLSGRNVPASSKEGWGDRGRASDGPGDRRAARSTLVGRHVPRPKRVGIRSALKRSAISWDVIPTAVISAMRARACSMVGTGRRVRRRRRRRSPSSVTAASPPSSASAAVHPTRVPFPAGCSSRSAATTVVRRAVTEFPAASVTRSASRWVPAETAPASSTRRARRRAGHGTGRVGSHCDTLSAAGRPSTSRRTSRTPTGSVTVNSTARGASATCPLHSGPATRCTSGGVESATRTRA